MHTARDRDRDRDREMMPFYMYCTHFTGTRTGTGNHCFLLYPSQSLSLSRFWSCIVCMRLNSFVSDFSDSLKSLNFVKVLHHLGKKNSPCFEHCSHNNRNLRSTIHLCGYFLGILSVHYITNGTGQWSGTDIGPSVSTCTPPYTKKSWDMLGL